MPNSIGSPLASTHTRRPACSASSGSTAGSIGDGHATRVASDGRQERELPATADDAPRPRSTAC